MAIKNVSIDVQTAIFSLTAAVVALRESIAQTKFGPDAKIYANEFLPAEKFLYNLDIAGSLCAMAFTEYYSDVAALYNYNAE